MKVGHPLAWVIGIVVFLVMILGALYVVLLTSIGPDYRDHSQWCHSHGYRYWQDRDVCVIQIPVPK